MTDKKPFRMRSKYWGKCPACSEPFEVNEWIAYYPKAKDDEYSQSEAYHWDCRPQANEKKTMTNRIGCYCLDLYCKECKKSPAGCTCWEHPEKCGSNCCPAQFTGRTETACLIDARAAGWHLGKRKENDLCPRHNPRNV